MLRRPDTAVGLLRRAAHESGDAEAYVEVDSRLSFGNWDRSADGLAGALAGLGVRFGDVVSLLLPSSADYAVCYQACMRLGAISSGINTRLGATEVDDILARTDSGLLILDDAIEPPRKSPRIVLRSQLASLYAHSPLPCWPQIAPSTPVALVWTSGTTGRPKGAVFDHANLEAVSAGAGEMGATADRRISATPFPHVGYMSRQWEEIDKLITTVIPPTPWRAHEALALMVDERVTVGQGVPTQWRLLLDLPHFDEADLTSLRIAGTGAAVVPPTLVREMLARLGCPVVIGYTSTEAAITTGSVSGDSVETVCNTVGRARSNVELRIVDEQSRPVATGEVGRVSCRSGAVMRRYWRDADLTAQVLDTNGWLTTGDLGRLDDRGYLTLVGRRTEMYIRGGYNVYPAEVERVVSTHPEVEQVAVIGRPDPVLGEIGIAFVVRVNGSALSDSGIRAWCRRELADYKAPDRVRFIADLPLTAMGKIDKVALARDFGEDDLGTWLS